RPVVLFAVIDDSLFPWVVLSSNPETGRDAYAYYSQGKARPENSGVPATLLQLVDGNIRAIPRIVTRRIWGGDRRDLRRVEAHLFKAARTESDDFALRTPFGPTRANGGSPRGDVNGAARRCLAVHNPIIEEEFARFI